MRFYKQVVDGYILSVGTGDGFTEITGQEYEAILTAVENKPEDTETVYYRLREDLTWEANEVEPGPDDDEIDDAEAFEIIFGGGGE